VAPPSAQAVERALEAGTVIYDVPIHRDSDGALFSEQRAVSRILPARPERMPDGGGGADPTAPFFALTHSAPPDSAGPHQTFVTEGIDDAIKRAKAAGQRRARTSA
jgi:hypothetical protein